jgi:adenosylcobinamide-GDP ribazoletransferase
MNGARDSSSAAERGAVPPRRTGGVVHELRLSLIAVQFLTRVPIPRWVGFEPDWLNQCARHFPLVGLGVGAFAVAVLWAAALVLPWPVAVLLSMASTVWLTGGFHEDGWADTCDGLGGTVSRERALEIMKDSRLGSYAALGLFFMLAIKASALISLPWPAAAAALLMGHAVSRAASVTLIRFLPYAGDVAHAKAKPLTQHISTAGWGVALGWALLVAVGAVAWHSAWAIAVLASIVAAAIGALVCGRWFKRRLGGVTGDTLGATQQVTELLVLLVWSAVVATAQGSTLTKALGALHIG